MIITAKVIYVEPVAAHKLIGNLESMHQALALCNPSVVRKLSEGFSSSPVLMLSVLRDVINADVSDGITFTASSALRLALLAFGAARLTGYKVSQEIIALERDAASIILNERADKACRSPLKKYSRI